MAEHAIGVVIERGARNWQIFQQRVNGTADISLSGRWLTQTPYKTVRVLVRLMDEANLHPVTRTLDWQPAETNADGTWSLTLKRVPHGGLYRLETGLNFDGGASEWSQRGDAVHHLGVGDIWVITGQSNSAGYGKSPIHDPPELGIHMFHACGEWRLATHPLSDSTDTQYPANREAANGSHSPYLAFARKLKQALGYPIGLIPAALGGSPLSAWHRPTGGVLFNNMLAYVRDAGGHVRGMCWYQGCSDTGPDQRAVYLQRFGEMVADARRALRSPRLPVITAQLNRYIGEPYDRPTHAGWDVIREIQRQAAHEIPGVEVVGTLDLGLSDGIHNHSAANLTLGERMADAAIGAVHGMDVKYKHPDLLAARRAGEQSIELVFANIDGRLHYENNIPEQWPFRVMDAQGQVPVTAWKLPARDVLRLELARSLSGAATVTGAPTGCPPYVVPFDTCGYRPMLAFTVTVA